MKTCKKCQQAHPATLEFFGPEKLSRDGLRGACRTCFGAGVKAWKTANREKVLARRKELYSERHSESQGAKRRAYIDRTPRRARAQIMRQGMINRARNRGLAFDAETLTVEWLLTMLEAEPKCPCCGAVFDSSFKHDGRPNNRSPTIDRLRPAEGYVAGNITMLCWRCNNLKRDATAAELRGIADWMISVGLG